MGLFTFGTERALQKAFKAYEKLFDAVDDLGSKYDDSGLIKEEIVISQKYIMLEINELVIHIDKMLKEDPSLMEKYRAKIPFFSMYADAELEYIDLNKVNVYRYDIDHVENDFFKECQRIFAKKESKKALEKLAGSSNPVSISNALLTAVNNEEEKLYRHWNDFYSKVIDRCRMEFLFLDIEKDFTLENIEKNMFVYSLIVNGYLSKDNKYKIYIKGIPDKYHDFSREFLPIVVVK